MKYRIYGESNKIRFRVLVEEDDYGWPLTLDQILEIEDRLDKKMEEKVIIYCVLPLAEGI